MVHPQQQLCPALHIIGSAKVLELVATQTVPLLNVTHLRTVNVVAPMVQLWHLDQHLIYVPEGLLLRYQAQVHGTGHAMVNMADHQPAVVPTEFRLLMVNVVAPMALLWHLDQHLIYVPEGLLLRYQGQDRGIGHAPDNIADHQPAVALTRHPIL
ncbi:MAG: hypothetical protein CMH28_09735 [Micavibrio sp.]|nr:hypothetical protein [Micavibrio sp.]